MRNTVRVAAVQAEPKWLRLSDGVEQVVELIGAAAAEGARLVAFPETFLPGYPWWRWVESNQWNVEYSTRCRENSMTRDGAEMRKIAIAARRNDIHVVLGFGERQERRIFMAQAVISDRGKVLSVRRKAGLNSVERKVFASGAPQLPAVHHSPFGSLGALSGQENQRTLLTRALRADEESIHVAAWPGGPAVETSPAQSGPTVSRMYALEGSAFVLAPCAVVGDTGWGGVAGVRTGQAHIFAADGGEVVPALAEGAEGILYAELELGAGELADPDRGPRLDPRGSMRGPQQARGWGAGPRSRTGQEARAMPAVMNLSPRFAAAC
ncbi:nitrilase-related carbon-nitrogen hydrolase [Nocardia yamanashiensis]|uniref:nitrilase-related carbon-nitrogen hydrolase n=1 Tax=Nocardia yamanashiensis TaxID=209247 RepID=UPI000A03F93B|nr:nitrilase-related carbon-nitrogen hydrolase [Nocardia yamanashiensis]